MKGRFRKEGNIAVIGQNGENGEIPPKNISFKPSFHMILTVGDLLQRIGDLSPISSVTYGNDRCYYHMGIPALNSSQRP